MTKLEVVRRVLSENSSVVVVHEEERINPDCFDSFAHTVDIFVGLKEASYETDELQQLMMGLIPDLAPTQKDDFREYHDLELGKLYFDEVVGSVVTRTETAFTDPILFPTESFVDGYRVIYSQRQILRRVWVRLYPNSELATRAGLGQDQFRIPKVLLEELRKGVKQKTK